MFDGLYIFGLINLAEGVGKDIKRSHRNKKERDFRLRMEENERKLLEQPSYEPTKDDNLDGGICGFKSWKAGFNDKRQSALQMYLWQGFKHPEMRDDVKRFFGKLLEREIDDDIFNERWKNIRDRNQQQLVYEVSLKESWTYERPIENKKFGERCYLPDGCGVAYDERGFEDFSLEEIDEYLKYEREVKRYKALLNKKRCG